MKRAIVAGALLSALAGCAVVPNTVRFEVDHTSHVSQHFDGTPPSQRRQFQEIGLVAHWQARGTYFEVGEYYSPDTVDSRHEVFQARAGYEFRVRP